MSSDLFIKLNKSPHEWLNDLEGLSLEGICKQKQDEISHLVDMLKIKQEKLNKLRLGSNILLNNNSIKNGLLEKYRFETGDKECSTAANTLFGLSEIDVDSVPTVNSNEIDGSLSVKSNNKLSPLGKISMNASQKGSWQLLSGNSTSVNFPSRLILMKLKIVKLLISLHEEKCTTIQYINKSQELTEKMCDLLLLKQKTIFKLVEAYQRAFNSLNMEAQLLKFKILKNYYSEDEGVVKASRKLKEIILTQVEALESKETELTEKLKAFKKLEGTQFDRLLRDYLMLRQSINDKKWALENMK